MPSTPIFSQMKLSPWVQRDSVVVRMAKDTHLTRPCVIEISNPGSEKQEIRMTEDEARYLVNAWGL